MRVNGDPPPAAWLEQERRPSRPSERFTTVATPERVPRHDDAERLVRTQSVQLVEAEREVADGRPDIAPLLLRELFTTRDDRRVCSECDDVLAE